MKRQMSKFSLKDILKAALLLCLTISIYRAEKIQQQFISLTQSDFPTQEQISSFHFPLGENSENILPITSNDRKLDHEIRYATFGTSKAWGAALPDPSTQSYVKLLDPNGGNYALKSNGPNFPAACTYTMMGDNEYDVIILEYWRAVAMQGMMELAIRVRERFPDAIIIILRIWEPVMLKNPNLDNIDMYKWAKENGFGLDWIHDPKFEEAFLKTGQENWRWQFEQEQFKFWSDFQDDVAKQVGGYVISMPMSNQADGPNGYLHTGDMYFAHDSFHPSEYGHQDLANRIKALVDRVGVPKNPHVREFKNHDYCLDWFKSGEVGQDLKYSPNAIVEKMPNSQKYAMSFRGGEGFIEITNPTNELLYLFVAYMTTSPQRNYPETEVSASNGKKMVLSPITEGFDNKVHVAQFGKMGHVDPRTTIKLNFKELEKSEWPFRLTRVVLTPREDFGFHKINMEQA